MSGALAVLVGTTYGTANSAWELFLSDLSLFPVVLDVHVTFGTGGTTSAVGAGSSPDWFLPAHPGIGSAWSVRVTNIDGIATTYGGDAMGVWQSLATSKTFIFSNATSGSEGSGHASVEFSPDGGASIVVAGEITWDVGYTP